MLGSAREPRMNSLAMFPSEFLQMDNPKLVDQQKFIYISFVKTLDAMLKTCQEWWLIGIDGERELRESGLLTCYDDV